VFVCRIVAGWRADVKRARGMHTPSERPI
jgi:hypothetical protein